MIDIKLIRENKDLVKEKLDLLYISNENYNLSIFPVNYKINAKKLTNS